jgi:CheY-like chemotaxis protein
MSDAPRILFVDDEQRVLDGLRRMLRPRHEVWDMVFAPSGSAALAELAGPKVHLEHPETDDDGFRSAGS